MNEPTLTALMKRFEQLERENRRWRRAGMVVLAGIAAVILMGQVLPPTVAKVIEAERFVVRDLKGQERVILGMGKVGPSIELLDERGVKRAVLDVGLHKPSLTFFDSNAKQRVSLEGSLEHQGKDLGSGGLSLTNVKGYPEIFLGTIGRLRFLNLFDESGVMRASLAIAISPYLALYDTNRKKRVEVEEIGIALSDGDEKARALLGMIPEGTSNLIFKRSDGATIWVAP